jgi:hypothetical protein
MEESQIATQEILHKISRPPLNLRISNHGDIALQGDINSDDLQTILDASYLRNSLYLEHQKQLDRESNLMVLYIGLIFSSLIGLIAFCFFNQSPKYPTQHSYRIENHECNGQPFSRKYPKITTC